MSFTTCLPPFALNFSLIEGPLISTLDFNSVTAPRAPDNRAWRDVPERIPVASISAIAAAIANSRVGFRVASTPVTCRRMRGRASRRRTRCRVLRRSRIFTRSG